MGEADHVGRDVERGSDGLIGEGARHLVTNSITFSLSSCLYTLHFQIDNTIASSAFEATSSSNPGLLSSPRGEVGRWSAGARARVGLRPRLCTMASVDPSDPASFNHRFVIAGKGHRYHVVDQPPVNWVGNLEDAPTLLLCHGFPDLWYGYRYRE